MNRNRDDYEPIIAERRPREPLREDARSAWGLVLGVGAGLVIAALLAWWWINRSSSDDASTTAESETSSPEIRPEVFPEERIVQAPLPPARGLESGAAVAPAP